MKINRQKYFVIWLLGLMSGFTLMISGNTLNFWLAKENIDIRTIGIFALISIPYGINFLWAPIFDVHKLPVLTKVFGNRLAWILLIQIFLSIAVYTISGLDPSNDIEIFAITGLIISFFSSAQDTILGAIRTEIVSKSKQGQIAGVYIFGYRIGMLLSSSGAIYFSAFISWSLVYELMSVVILTFPILLILLSKYLKPEKDLYHDAGQIMQKQNSILQRPIGFISDILKPVGPAGFIILTLCFLILYRLPDNFIGVMINPFLIHLGYDEFEVASTGKFFGVFTAIIGGLIAGFIMKNKSIFESLLIFGALHAVAHLLFIIQEEYGKNLPLLFLVIGFEGTTGGMSMAAYIALIASLCHGKFRATQYSFFSSMMGLSRSIFPALSGYIVMNWGWKSFYFFTTIATIPALILLLYLHKSYNLRRETGV
jgi:PAT family beta-lactamase induction signal transducer AmpG